MTLKCTWIMAIWFIRIHFKASETKSDETWNERTSLIGGTIDIHTRAHAVASIENASVLQTRACTDTHMPQPAVPTHTDTRTRVGNFSFVRNRFFPSRFFFHPPCPCTSLSVRNNYLIRWYLVIFRHVHFLQIGRIKIRPNNERRVQTSITSMEKQT